MFAAMLLIVVVQAANVGTVVLLADGSLNTECVNIDDGETAYHAFQETSLTMDWSYTVGIGHFLNSVEGVASDNDAGKYWSFWHINSAETDFESAMVGASDYEIETDDKVIGLSYTSFDNSWNPITKPPFSNYDNICEPILDVEKVSVEIDGDKDTLKEGDSFKVKPGDLILLSVKVGNLHEDNDLEDVEVEAIIRNIDDGDDLEEQSDSTDIGDGKDETLELELEIPFDADEGDYELEVTVTGSIDIPYRQVLLYEVEVDKESHELAVGISETVDLECGKSYRLNIEIDNIGKDDEDVSLTIINSDMDISIQDSFDVDENEGTSKSYSFRVPSASIGSYSLLTTLVYSDERDEYRTTLNVDCGEETQDGNLAGLPNAGAQNLNPGNSQPQLNYTSSNSNQTPSEDLSPIYVVLLIVGNIILVLIVIIVIVRWRKN